MTAAAGASPRARRSLPRSVALAALAGGAVDLAYAFAVGAAAGRSPERVLQSIAGGWQGRAAFEGGAASAALGAVTHFAIAAAMAGAFALAAERAPMLYRRPLIAGPLYGLVLYGVMYRIVLPLRWPETFPRFDGWRSVADVLAHVGVGLAIVLVLRRGRSG